MATVSINRLTPGSILSRDVTLPSGALLARTGTILTERHVVLFKQRDVRVVEVDDDADTESKEVSPQVYQQRCERLETIFEGTAHLPHMQALKSAARVHLKLKRPWE
jgi:hypothetical protein